MKTEWNLQQMLALHFSVISAQKHNRKKVWTSALMAHQSG